MFLHIIYNVLCKGGGKKYPVLAHPNVHINVNLQFNILSDIVQDLMCSIFCYCFRANFTFFLALLGKKVYCLRKERCKQNPPPPYQSPYFLTLQCSATLYLNVKCNTYAGCDRYCLVFFRPIYISTLT